MKPRAEQSDRTGILICVWETMGGKVWGVFVCVLMCVLEG